MLVSVEFDVNGTEYRIERGRTPNVLKFYKENEEQKDEEDFGVNGNAGFGSKCKRQFESGGQRPW